MRALGDKASARRVAMQAGVPVIPATEVLGDDIAAIKREAAAIGYPLMLKASWGGGGRGMRPIPRRGGARGQGAGRPAARPEAALATAEANLERMILRAPAMWRFRSSATSRANIYHLWERDCSVQRRNQKVVERAPAPYLSQEQRRRSANWPSA
jgi:pyruvate carboxylase